MKYAIGVDIGGTNSRIALVDENMDIITRSQFPTDTQDPNKTVEALADEINRMAEGKEITGMGISCPGALDLINGIVMYSNNLHGGWKDYPIAKAVTERTGIPAWLENDANLAALAEAVVGEGRDMNNVQFLTISTGIGAGHVIDRKIQIGAHGFANEVSYAPMWRNGPSHGGIFPGGIEAISSGTGITTRAMSAGLDVKHAGEVNDLAIAGNETAAQIMDEAKEYLANFIATIQALDDPDIVILGGSVALKIPGFVEDVEKRVQERVLGVVSPFVKVHATTLNEDSGLLGAAALAFEKTKE